jgi:hypothetical protein
LKKQRSSSRKCERGIFPIPSLLTVRSPSSSCGNSQSVKNDWAGDFVFLNEEGDEMMLLFVLFDLLFVIRVSEKKLALAARAFRIATDALLLFQSVG